MRLVFLCGFLFPSILFMFRLQNIRNHNHNSISYVSNDKASLFSLLLSQPAFFFRFVMVCQVCDRIRNQLITSQLNRRRPGRDTNVRGKGRGRQCLAVAAAAVLVEGGHQESGAKDKRERGSM